MAKYPVRIRPPGAQCRPTDPYPISSATRARKSSTALLRRLPY